MTGHMGWGHMGWGHMGWGHMGWVWGWGLAVTLVLAAPAARAADSKVAMALATPTGPGDSIGDITISQSASGAMFTLNLKKLPPGPHGFHVHEKGSCGPATVNNVAVPAGAAGGHWDSGHTGKHEGPAGAGHSGDLPVLVAGGDGTASQSLTASRIKDIALLKGHALMILLNGDNYSDQPAALGGGGARFACGVIN